MELVNYQEGGKLGLFYLKRVWSFYDLRKKYGVNNTKISIDWSYINAVFNVLGLGIEPTLNYLFAENKTFEEFEEWILKNGNVSKGMIQHFNEMILSTEKAISKVEEEQPILSEADKAHWEEQGYVIIREAIPQKDCEETVSLIYDFLGASSNDPSSWYKPHPAKQGIMVQLFKEEILNKNRLSKKIRQAYEELWNRKDLFVSMDRVSFNPPETDSYQFPGPNLHWDMSLKQPIPFGLQGLLYLTDTAENQGAFTLVPGFHNKIEQWLNNLPAGQDPRKMNLEELGAKRISAKGGDLIIWHQALPHGSSKNTSTQPRIVQYINYQPLKLDYQKDWT